jgi:hypothetical protein
LADSNASMAVDDDNKDEVIEEVEEEDGTWDKILDEEDEEAEKKTKVTAPGM